MMRQLLFLVVVAIATFGCKKIEGDGGAAKIRGKVYVIDFKDDYSLLPDTMLALEEDIYIKYGSNDVIDDKNTTNQNGEYGFNYLRTGNYSIIAYGKNPEKNGEDTAIVKTIKISSKKGTANVENIYLYKSKTGYASITGHVYAKDYNATMQPKTPEDNYYSGGEDVYLQKVGSTVVLDKQKTSEDGMFVFSHLSKGQYKVYAYSKDTVLMSGSNGNDYSTKPQPSIINCQIETIGQQLQVSNIVIIK
jgi:hypothetical protein